MDQDEQDEVPFIDGVVTSFEHGKVIVRRMDNSKDFELPRAVFPDSLVADGMPVRILSDPDTPAGITIVHRIPENPTGRDAAKTIVEWAKNLPEES